MASPTRIYVVRNKLTEDQSLIRATSPAQAIRHAAQQTFDVEVAGQDDLVDLISDGKKVEVAGEELSDPDEQPEI